MPITPVSSASRLLANVALCVLLVGCATASQKDLARAPALKPYVAQLKESTSPEYLREIRDMAKSELILLHFGLGMGIRNQWLWGNRDPALINFFRTNGIADPDGASMVIIEALWDDLNSDLTPAEREAVNAKRAVVARKLATYEKLESECHSQLAKSNAEFERCYKSFGLPSKNPESRDPCWELLVNRSGHVRDIVFFDGASAELKACLREIIQGFTFSAFRDDEFVTLDTDFPFCRVEERDKLHGAIPLY